jgi:hypothetical protein
LTDPVSALAASRRALERLPDVLDALAGDLDPAITRTRPAHDEWAPVEILCHLRDEETEDFGARVRVVVEGGRRFAPNDPERLAIERRYLDDDGPGALAAFHERRVDSLAFLAGLAPERLSGAAERPNGGALSGLDLLAAWVAHDRLHVAQLAATLARNWAEHWRPLRTEYAGPIPYARST